MEEADKDMEIDIQNEEENKNEENKSEKQDIEMVRYKKIPKTPIFPIHTPI